MRRRVGVPPPKRACEKCQVVFQPRRLDQRFCTAACRKGTLAVKPDRKCDTCGNLYSPFRRAQRFCSYECRQSQMTRQHTPGNLASRECKFCGQIYSPWRRDQKRCSSECPGPERREGDCVECGTRFVAPLRSGGAKIYCTYECRDRASKRRAGDRFRRYELAPEEYDAMVVAQDNRCASCKEEPKNSDRYGLVVDHDHVTGAIRGLLCNKCNLGLGMFGDQVEKLKMAITYLMSYQASLMSPNESS